ncbi:hypothetical protein MY10362_009128 [Beauveria mimosiformis]
MTSLKLVHRLDSLTDWPLWDHELKRRADAEGLWPYIDSTSSQTLVEPDLPTPPSFDKAISALNSSIEYVDDQEEALPPRANHRSNNPISGDGHCRHPQGKEQGHRHNFLCHSLFLGRSHPPSQARRSESTPWKCRVFRVERFADTNQSIDEVLAVMNTRSPAVAPIMRSDVAKGEVRNVEHLLVRRRRENPDLEANPTAMKTYLQKTTLGRGPQRPPAGSNTPKKPPRLPTHPLEPHRPRRPRKTSDPGLPSGPPARGHSPELPLRLTPLESGGGCGSRNASYPPEGGAPDALFIFGGGGSRSKDNG